MKKEQKFIVTIECEVYARTVEEAQAKVCVLKNRLGSEVEPEAHNLVLCDGSLYGKAYDANNSAVETLIGRSTDFDEVEEKFDELKFERFRQATHNYLLVDENKKFVAQKIANNVSEEEYDFESDFFTTYAELGGEFGLTDVEVYYERKNGIITEVGLQFTHDGVNGDVCVDGTKIIADFLKKAA